MPPLIHLNIIKKRLEQRLTEKYWKGHDEHKESMMDKEDLLEEALDELIDCFVYVITEIMRKEQKHGTE